MTAHVQGWVNGTLPNYGWAHAQGLWTFHMSEAGSALQPVLFIDYTPGGGSPDTTAPAAVANLGHSLASLLLAYDHLAGPRRRWRDRHGLLLRPPVLHQPHQ